MRIGTDRNGAIVIGEVYNGAYLETGEGNRIGFCMRDDTIEFTILPKGQDDGPLCRVNMDTASVSMLHAGSVGDTTPATGKGT